MHDTPAPAPSPVHDSASAAAPAPPPVLPGFTTLPALVARHAAERPDATAVVVGDERLAWRDFDALVGRVAASLQRDGVHPQQQTVAVCAATSPRYLAIYVGALRAGVAVAPLAPSSTPAQLVDMATDADAAILFVDAAVAGALDEAGATLPAGVRRIRIDDSGGDTGFAAWLAPDGAAPAPVDIQPGWAFNLIYSSGTTGTPKGIVQSHAMRWAHIQRAASTGYGTGSVTLIATPLYSNTTLVAVIPTLAYGGCVVLMPKFDAGRYLALAQAVRATHTMLVPVQYTRLMARPDFDSFDLSSFQAKSCTSAPFHADLKADILKRWPGTLTEIYGMTEGGGTCLLQAHLHPNKLHTVGQPVEGHDIRLIDEAGHEIPRTPGQPTPLGEVVGRSPGMMNGYHKQPGKTREAEWYDAAGVRFIRTGDVGRFDEDGFLILGDRRKDMVISGGFNIYPSDLEAVLRRHPAVADCAVFGVPSAEWGETPVAAVVRRAGDETDAEAIRAWVNGQVGKTQRLSALKLVDELPRSAIGKVLKRELREGWAASAA